MRCYVRLGTRMSMVAKMKNDSSIIMDEELVMMNIKKYCPRAYTNLVNLIKVANATLSKLPVHVKEILEQVAHQSPLQTLPRNFQMAANATKLQSDLTAGNADAVQLINNYLEAVKTITPDERKQMGDLFPKLAPLITGKFILHFDIFS